MKVALAKPDYRILGGFERVSEAITDQLVSAGHEVRYLRLDAVHPLRQCRGIDIPAKVWDSRPDFFSYSSLLGEYEMVDASDCDLLISTQPPSFGVEHAKHLSVFYHHHRSFYDLCDLRASAGIASSQEHLLAAAAVRAMDQPHLEAVTHFLTPSAEVRERLHHFNGLTEHMSPYLAAPAIQVKAAQRSQRTREDVLCISRHEFGKRTELFVHAMKYLPTEKGLLVGVGGRRSYARLLDRWLSQPDVDLDSLTAGDIWLNGGDPTTIPRSTRATDSNVTMAGWVEDEGIGSLYDRSLCAVAPAYREDYGLTAIEAMSHGCPLVVCSDGGGLTDFVEHEVTGLVSEPTGSAIAGAIRRLRDNPEEARAMADRAREVAATYTPERAQAQLLAGIEAVMS